MAPTKLCRLAYKYGADKAIECGDRHSYTPYYYSLFKDRRATVKKVLEIGIDKGASLKMWHEFFPNAKIYGADYRKELLINSEGIESVLCDQRRSEHLRRLIDHIGEDIDLVIDDGSHRAKDQRYTCTKLMPLLQKKVVYVIEDVANVNIVAGLQMYNIELPRLQRTGNSYDNRLVVVRY